MVPHPPVAHGDFFGPEPAAGDVAVVVDDFAPHRPGARHKEYLHALDRGVTVIGAAGVGALRALELGPFGVRGVGTVHELYRSGVLDGDDAVAVAHEEEAPYARLSVPLVNLRAAAQAACAEGLLRAAEIERVVETLRREYYPSRTQDRVVHLLRRAGRPQLADWYARRVADDPHIFDQQRRDCLAAIEAARRTVAEGVVGRVTGAGDAAWRTVALRAWRNHFVAREGSPPLGQRIAYQQLFNPYYARVWNRYLEDSLPGGPAVTRLPLPAARERERRLADADCPVPDLSDPHEVALLLSAEEPADIEAVAAQLRRDPAPGFDVGPRSRRAAQDPARELSEDAGRVLLCHIWQIPAGELAGECRSRGIPDVETAVRMLRPFVAGAGGAASESLRAETA
ncbi:TfuA-like protein [Streptomyces zhaozhouensis]|uniref:TfuA-like protein n=1 Tax=Streptomyces zhaozhouensis TaxID=1300267 RepID=UPI0014851A38|nr:TfuA-like protein [Streptomyces zhaozhouensis]